MHFCNKKITTVFTYLMVLIISMIFFPIVLPITLLNSCKRYDNKFYFFVSKLVAKLIIFVSFITVKVRGLQNLPVYPNQPSIILMNHSSLLDIPLIESVFNQYPHIWVSNDYTGIPILGLILSRMNVVVKKNNPKDTFALIRKISLLIKNKKRHLFIFPEGTRHSDGKIHPFLGGFYILAKTFQRPVIPIAIHGMHKIFPKNRFTIDYSDAVKISIGKPIFFDENESKQDFLDKVNNWFKIELKNLEKNLFISE
jgi:1-acyl-sn-glycerol-3-phosphate acyltransferase